MSDFDINNPNDYVPDTAPSSLPPSAIGKGGLSAIAVAGRGSPSAPNLGGLSTGNGQADLENLLYSRVRSADQLTDAKQQRRGGLSKLQEALAAPEDTMSGIERIAMGMAHNDKPWDVGNGFRGGIANAMDARVTRDKLARDSGIESANQEMKFNTGEEKIDDSVESNALNNLRGLARPIRGGGVNGGGIRFKNVPGTGLVDTWSVDDLGVPKVVYGDGKVLTEQRMAARKIAEKEAESEQNNLTFKTDAERQDWVAARADQIVGATLTGTVPGKMNNGTTVPPVAGAGGPAATAMPGKPVAPITIAGSVKTGRVASPAYDANYDFESLNAEKLAKFAPEVQRDILAAMQAAGKDTSMFKSVDPTLDVSGSKIIEGPEGQKGRVKTAEEVAKQQAEAAAALKSNAETGMNMKSTVDELQQLKFNPGMFAKWKQRGGNLMEAFGVNGPLAQMAAQSGNAESLLQALSNARISLEKGVQTRDDEIRFKNELAKITDPHEAYDYMLTHMRELGDKSIDHYNTVESFRKANGGSTYDGADQVWQKRNEDRGGMVKRYQGTFIGRSDFIDRMVSDPNNVKAYGGDTEKLRARAEKEWRSLGGK